jgi:hypothetical protein
VCLIGCWDIPTTTIDHDNRHHPARRYFGRNRSVPRNWFSRTKEQLVPIEANAIRDEQTVIDLYAEAGLLPARIEAASAFDDSFNAAIRRGKEPSQ